MLPCNSSNKCEAFSWLFVAKSSLSDSSFTALLDTNTSTISIAWDVGSPAFPADTSYEMIVFVALEADGTAWTIVLVAISTNFIAEGSTFLPAFWACVTYFWSDDVRVLPADTMNIPCCSIDDVSNCFGDTWGYSLDNFCSLGLLLRSCKLSLFSDCNTVSKSNGSCKDSFVDE